MRIAFVSQPLDGVLPPRQNSIGIWTWEVSRRMAAAGHRVTVYVPGTGWRMREADVQGARFVHVPLEPDRWLAKLTSRLFRHPDPRRPDYAAGHAHLGYVWQVARDLRRRDCDVIHVMNFTQFVPVIRRLNRGPLLALNMRCEWLSQLDPALMEPRVARTDLVVGCSRHVTRETQRRFPQHADRCRTVFNGVDVDAFAAATGRRGDSGGRNGSRLLFVGRVSPEKGVHVLIEAMPQILRARPDAELEIVGGHRPLPWRFLVGVSDDPRVQALSEFYRGSARGFYVEQLKARVHELGLTERVGFTGSLPYAEVADRYRRADVLINPSFSESFGRSPVEAMSCGLPVVASRIGGMLDSVADGETGFLCEPGDSGALAAAVLKLLENPELRRRLGAAARARVRELFSWESIVASLENTYGEELARRG